MPLRAGIVGCGGISRSHATAYSHLSATDLVATCDIDPDRLREHADQFAVPARYSDFREMFARESLDVVSVCTHAPLHADVACAAAAAGTHVLCEKPLALDLESADRMVRECAAAGVQLAVSHQFRFVPALRIAKEWVQAGRIGNLISVREVGKGRPAGFELMEMGVHFFDELAFFMDGIEWIHARVTYRGREAEVGDIVHSSELCTTDPRDNGMVAGDVMLIHAGGPGGVSGVVELYPRPERQNWVAGPHLVGDAGQLMVKSNPDPKLGDTRSTHQDGANPHPFLSDPAVTRALSLAIDRDILVEAGYGPAGQVTCNVLSAPPVYASTANDWCMTQDVEFANRLLDEAGWVRGRGGIRAKDGVRLSILYQTSTNSVRQGTQALIKQMWREIGVETELRNINASVFFGSDPASPDTYQKFYADIQMYTNNFDGTDPQAYMAGWICDKIPGLENQWNGSNISRYCNPEYDVLAAEFAETGAIEQRAAIAKRMNDLLIEDGALIPLIHRGEVAARSLTLGGVRHNAWDATLWNVHEWYRIE